MIVNKKLLSIDFPRLHGGRREHVPDFARRIQRIGGCQPQMEGACRCGWRAKKNGMVNDGIITVLKQKVLFLKVDTHHFKGKKGMQLDLDLGEI